MWIPATWGPSQILAIGPYTAGWTWTSECGHLLPPGVWATMDGRLPHASTPYFETRVSVVLYTHNATLLEQSAPALTRTRSMGIPAPINIRTTPNPAGDTGDQQWIAILNAMQQYSKFSEEVTMFAPNTLMDNVQQFANPRRYMEHRHNANLIMVMRHLVLASCAIIATAGHIPTGSLRKSTTSAAPIRLVTLLDPPPYTANSTTAKDTVAVNHECLRQENTPVQNLPTNPPQQPSKQPETQYTTDNFEARVPAQTVNNGLKLPNTDGHMEPIELTTDMSSITLKPSTWQALQHYRENGNRLQRLGPYHSMSYT